MKKKFSILLSLILTINLLSAKEGMWLPLLLKSLNESDMQSMGLKLSAEDIYHVNQSSLKDAVVSFGGFCTGEIISDQGLLLTNHHCGYGQIQSHSSLEKDYLTNGYWAMNHSEELLNPGLTATFIVRMEDVTEKILRDLEKNLTESEQQIEIDKRIKNLIEETTKDSEYGAYIRPFFYGNEYYMFITETFKDVRLVGAPPSAVGKFGGDTDNWMWPRHTGDFSLFRIYADKNNKPAEYSEDNVPYQPKHFFPISMNGVEKGDFTMVFGFPGRTQEYLTSYGIAQTKDVINPAQIQVREEALKIMDKHMKANDNVRIQYAAKYARIANYWKKWIGENRGLEKANAIKLKEQKQKEFEKATADKKEYTGLMDAFQRKYNQIEKYALARSYWIEIPYQKMEILRLASQFTTVIDDKLVEKQVDEKEIENLKNTVNAHFKNYNLKTDQEVSLNLLNYYLNGVDEKFIPEVFKSAKDKEVEVLSKAFEKSIFSDQEKLLSKLDDLDKSTAKKLKKDPMYQIMNQFWSVYRDEIKPEYNRLSNEIDSLSKIYVEGLRKYVPGTYYPDANSTLRLAYGQVDDYEPRDGVEYTYFTTTDGILQKYDPSNVDFDLPASLVELIRSGDFGPYADKDGSLHVCFTASNHTTGGNSGSPVINGNGELIGLNFDRNWEGTMSDINYNIDQCRNISVDIRYVLFIIDKYAKAKHLIKEMKLVRTKNAETSQESN